ncbi:MAG: hypothetical protein K2R93_19125 [Gemmatimonadaceae bacterium]|nr:hypothetical protein [Gemmatimonadaceae bacterium]
MRAYIPMALAITSLAAAPLAAQTTTADTASLPAKRAERAATRTVTVQNDRQAAVTFFIDAGRVEQAVGTVAAGQTGAIDLPEWAVRGARQITLTARATGDNARVARYELPLRDRSLLGLLVPPAEGLPANDSLLVSTPRGAARSATVTIDNARDRRVSVYAEQGLLFVLLGEVDPKSQRTLDVPAQLLRNASPLRVFARPEGNAPVSTNALRLKEGDHIAVVIM